MRTRFFRRQSPRRMALLLSLGASVWASTIVTPNAYQSTEASDAINLLPGSGVGQKQLWIINSDQFSALSGPTQIAQFAMRPNCDDPSCSFPGTAFGPTTIDNLQITLGVTSLAPTAVASDHTFADYLTSSSVVFSGNMTISSSDSGPALGPKVFDILFPFTTPFTYNPADGNLVVQFAVNGTGGIPSFVDGVQDGTGTVGRLFGGYSNATGIGDNFAPVLQFTTQAGTQTSVPEPGTITLSALALLGWIAVRNRRGSWYTQTINGLDAAAMDGPGTRSMGGCRNARRRNRRSAAAHSGIFL